MFDRFLKIIVPALAIAGAVFYALALDGVISSGDYALLGGALLLAVAAEFAWIPGSTQLQWSAGTTIHIFVMIAFSPSIAIVAGTTSILILYLVRRRDLRAIVSDSFGVAFELGVAAAVFSALGGQSHSVSGPTWFVAAIGMICTYALTNPLQAVMIKATLQPNPLAYLKDLDELFPGFNSFKAAYGFVWMEASIGVVTAIVWETNRWAALLMFPIMVGTFIVGVRGSRLKSVADAALEGFASVVDERDRYTSEHSQRVCDYSMMIGRQLELSPIDLERLYWTSRLHDLGKIAIDDTILNKPGKLTDDEFDKIKEHVLVSARIVSLFDFKERDAEIVLCHHERYDGRGYLKRDKDSVPLESFIIAVANSFDAMTTNRSYRDAMPVEAALEEVRRNIGSQFHPAVAEAFLTSIAKAIESGEVDGFVNTQQSSDKAA